MSLEKENRINTVINSILNNVNEIINVDTVIGKPYCDDGGDTIFPVSKVTAGSIIGGGEYGKVSVFKSEKDLPYSVGNGSIVSLSPCGFLIKKKNGDYTYLPVNCGKYDFLIEKATEILGSLNEKVKK